MNTEKHEQIETTLGHLFNDSKMDHLRMLTGAAKSIFRPMQPRDFKDAYLSISKEQGNDLRRLIIRNDMKNIVEFGTSFGISTLFLAQAAIETGGNVVTTELIESKALQAKENFKTAGVSDIIEVRIGDAMETLKNHNKPIDLLLLDGWKNLYLPIFELLESNFHKNTVIYVDNADMSDTQHFLEVISKNDTYKMESKYDGKVMLIANKNRVKNQIN